jgi:hypothetical protein
VPLDILMLPDKPMAKTFHTACAAGMTDLIDMDSSF